MKLARRAELATKLNKEAQQGPEQTAPKHRQTAERVQAQGGNIGGGTIFVSPRPASSERRAELAGQIDEAVSTLASTCELESFKALLPELRDGDIESTTLRNRVN